MGLPWLILWSKGEVRDKAFCLFVLGHLIKHQIGKYDRKPGQVVKMNFFENNPRRKNRLYLRLQQMTDLSEECLDELQSA